jgi:hypothetical protein
MQGDLSEIEVIIEIPKGCRNKYEYDPERKLFRARCRQLARRLRDGLSGRPRTLRHSSTNRNGTMFPKRRLVCVCL